jgi:hypothetical protein
LDDFARQDRNNEILKSALCQAIDDAREARPPADSVGSFVAGELTRGVVGIPLTFPQDKIDEFETTLELANWNGGIAARYARACLLSF